MSFVTCPLLHETMFGLVYGDYRDIYREAQPLAPPPLDSLGEAHAQAPSLRNFL